MEAWLPKPRCSLGPAQSRRLSRALTRHDPGLESRANPSPWNSGGRHDRQSAHAWYTLRLGSRMRMRLPAADTCSWPAGEVESHLRLIVGNPSYKEFYKKDVDGVESLAQKKKES